MRHFKKFLRIVEVIALFLSGALLARAIANAIGLKDWLAEANALIKAASIDFIGLALRTAVSMPLKYLGILVVVLVYLWATRQKFSYKALGLSANGKSALYILKSSILLFCLAGFLPKFMFYLWPKGWVGAGTEAWQLLYEPWTIEFWMFMLASSIILPPIFEELFFRGFAQSWLQKSFSVGWSILLMAVIFTVFHTQYFQASIVGISMLFSLFMSSVILGYAKYHTGTLIPGMIAHGLVNIPIIETPALFLAALMFVFSVMNAKRIIYHWHRFKALI